MKNKVYLAARVLLIALIICTLIFTFYQSSLPPEKSSEISGSVSEKLEPIIPSDTPTGEFVHTNIRKIAHFVEFAFLGTEIALYVILFMPKIGASLKDKLRFIVYSYVAAPIIALLDETLQVFTERGPAITDVWIDVGGFASFATIAYIVYFAVILIKRRLTAAKEKTAQ